MRFKKGIKVEVLSDGELSLRAWRPAEIIIGNGRYYGVRYYQPLGDRDCAMIGRVPRKAIRPCPPVRGAEIWVAGDIVEVFHNNLWKMAKVLRPLGGNYFFVRIFGPSLEIRVHKSAIRVRLSWKDDQWVLVGQNSRSIMRRSEFCSSHVETQMEAGWKKRAIEKEGRRLQLVSQHPSQLQEKVDAIGERILSQTRFEPNDAESSACCSVASCGGSDHSPYMLPHHSIKGPTLATNDAESYIGREYGRR